MVGTKNTALDIINNVIINIPALLFTHGNNDIDLMDSYYECRYNAEDITANVFEHYLDYPEPYNIIENLQFKIIQHGGKKHVIQTIKRID